MMARHNISERWVRNLEAEIESFENFEANQQWRTAAVAIFDETYDIGGIEAVEETGNYAMDIVENRRHPTTARLRETARSVLVRQDNEIPPGSELLKSRNG